MERVYPNIALRRKGWLTVVLRTFGDELIAHGTTTLTADAGSDETRDADEAASFDAWALGRMRALAFYYSAARQDRPTQANLGRHVFLETIAAQCQLVYEASVRLAGPRDGVALPLELAIVFALASGDLSAAERLHDVLIDLRDPHAPSLDAAWASKTLKSPLRALGADLKRNLLSDDHPLLDRAFHRLLIYADTRLLLDLTREVHTHTRLPMDAIQARLGRARLVKLCLLEAIAGLGHADGRLDKLEERLIDALIKLGGFNRQERRLLGRTLKTGDVDLVDIARHIQDPVSRRFLLEQLYTTAFVDGELSADETRYIGALGAAFGFSKPDLFQLELDMLDYLDRIPDLMRGLSLTRAIGRLRRHTQRSLEHLVRDNLSAILREARETGDLMQLLMRASRREQLTPDELDRAKAQLIDLCKTVPSLAMLAAPGGSVLMPIVLKLLPFDLMPSAFSDPDEVLLASLPSKPEPTP